MKIHLPLALSILVWSVQGQQLPSEESGDTSSLYHLSVSPTSPKFFQNWLSNVFQQKIQEMKSTVDQNSWQEKALNQIGDSIQSHTPRWAEEFQRKVQDYGLSLQKSLKGMTLDEMIRQPEIKNQIGTHVRGLWKSTVDSSLNSIQDQVIRNLTMDGMLANGGEETKNGKVALNKRFNQTIRSFFGLLATFVFMAATAIVALPLYIAKYAFSWVICIIRGKYNEFHSCAEEVLGPGF